MSRLTLRDLDLDQTLDSAAMHSTKGGCMSMLGSPSGGSFASATATAFASGNNTYAKAEAFAMAGPGGAAAGAYSMAISFLGWTTTISIASSHAWTGIPLSRLH